MTAADLAAAIAAGSPPAILDVRSAAEFADGHIPGAINVPYWRFFAGRPQVPADAGQRLLVYCGHGPRARMAMAVLRRRGYRRVEELDGHWSGWRHAGLPEATPPSSSPS